MVGPRCMPWIASCLAALALAGAARGEEEIAGEISAEQLIGRRIDDRPLALADGRAADLAAYGQRGPLVVAFLGTECPLAIQYARRLEALAERFAPQGVEVIGVFANAQDAADEIVAFGQSQGLTFPLVHDAQHALADACGATHTPQVMLLDGQRVIRYAGVIDDQFGFVNGQGYNRPRPQREYLAQAIEQLLAGQPIATAWTAPVGCRIGRVPRTTSASEVTWAKDVAPLLQRHCQACHRPNEIGPFSLLTYDDARAWGATIRDVVRERRMPPWNADPRYGHFRNDRRLEDAEVELICRWIDAGAPEGDPTEQPPPREFPDGWVIGRPDLVVKVSDEPIEIPATGVLDYMFFVQDPHLTEDRWMTAAECHPGARSVLHHMTMYAVPPELVDKIAEINLFPYLVVGLVPGERPLECPRGTARKIPAGSQFVFEMHYTPNGVAQRDRSQVGLRFAGPDEAITHPLQVVAIANVELEIPPGAPGHQVEASYRFDEAVDVMILNPHMHLRGKSFRFEADYPNGTRQTLLSVPRYDFYWQTNFVLDERVRLPAGTTVRCVAEYDNSADNPNNPDPTATVRWGRQSTDEMLVGAVGVVPVEPDPAWTLAPGGEPRDDDSRRRLGMTVAAAVAAWFAGRWAWQRARRERRVASTAA